MKKTRGGWMYLQEDAQDGGAELTRVLQAVAGYPGRGLDAVRFGVHQPPAEDISGLTAFLYSCAINLLEVIFLPVPAYGIWPNACPSD